MTLSRSDFPAGFLFGAATAACQIEATSSNSHGSSHRDTCAATPGNATRPEVGPVACDHCNKWPQVSDLSQKGSFKACRFSTSWNRVVPDGRTLVSAGAAFCGHLVDGRLQPGPKPIRTLCYRDLPSTLADPGGCTDRDVVAARYADHAESITPSLGDRVATTNGPCGPARPAHFIAAHASGQRDVRATARATRHALLAHGAAMKHLRGMGQKNFGIVLNFNRTPLPPTNPPPTCGTAS